MKLYNTEVEPGITYLFKSIQMANFEVARKLLDSGFIDVNY